MERQRIDAGAARYEITQDERVAAAQSSRIVRVTRAKVHFFPLFFKGQRTNIYCCPTLPRFKIKQMLG